MLFTTKKGRSTTILVLGLLATACGDGSGYSPTAPGPPPAAAEPSWWIGETTVLSSPFDNPVDACAFGTMAGEIWSGGVWQVTLSAPSLHLDQAVSYHPAFHINYNGTLDGRRFVASHETTPDFDPVQYCIRAARIEGEFAPDWSSFEAHETLFLGPLVSNATVERRWRVWRRAS